nr:helix-turn-helix domain-containing protein [Micromonospora sp. DSM 115978]
RELAFLDEQMDGLTQRTAAWGLARVDAAMAPLLARSEELAAELDELDEPHGTVRRFDDAAAEWDRAERDGDFDVMRSMVKAAFPNLVLRAARGPSDIDPARFDWDGTSDGNPLSRPSDLDRMRPLLARDEGATVAQLADLLGKDRAAVFKKLQHLERTGQVLKTVERDAEGRRVGWYRLPNTADVTGPDGSP